MKTCKIESTVKAISDLTFHQMVSHRPLLVSKAFHVAGITLMLGKKGTIYMSSLRSGDYWLRDSSWIGIKLRALEKMGVLKREDVDRHLADLEKSKQRRGRRTTAQTMICLADKMKIKLTAAQMKKVDRFIRS